MEQINPPLPDPFPRFVEVQPDALHTALNAAARLFQEEADAFGLVAVPKAEWDSLQNTLKLLREYVRNR